MLASVLPITVVVLVVVIPGVIIPVVVLVVIVVVLVVVHSRVCTPVSFSSTSSCDGVCYRSLVGSPRRNSLGSF